MRLSGKRKCCMYFHSWYLCKHGASLVGWWDHWAVAPLSAHWLRVPASHRTSAQSPGDKWTPAAGPGTSQQVSIQPSSNSDVNICMSKLKSSTSTILWINQCNHHWVQHVSRVQSTGLCGASCWQICSSITAADCIYGHITFPAFSSITPSGSPGPTLLQHTSHREHVRDL